MSARYEAIAELVRAKITSKADRLRGEAQTEVEGL